jgi:hypothetical protein
MQMTTVIWDDVRRIADELRLQIHLGSMEARERWQGLAPRLTELENTVAQEGERLTKAIADELGELRTTLGRLRDDIVKKP